MLWVLSSVPHNPALTWRDSARLLLRGAKAAITDRHVVIIYVKREFVFSLYLFHDEIELLAVHCGSPLVDSRGVVT